LPEPEVVAPATEAAVPAAPLTEATPPTETALTRAEIAELVSTAKAEVLAEMKKDLENAYKAARRGEAKGDTANAKVAKLETHYEQLATRGMDESEARLWKAQRAEERAVEATTTVSQQQEFEKAAADFQQRSSSYLNSEGISADDPVLTASFAKYSADARTYDDWDKALMRSVADVHKNKAKQAAESAKTVADKAREEERAKLRNEQRRDEGPIDRGSPASPAPKKGTWDMTDEEFKAYDAQKDAERKLRQRGVRTT